MHAYHACVTVCNWGWVNLVVVQVMVGLLPPAVFKAFVVIVRTLNNVIGGISFVTCARITGSQKSTPKEEEEPAGKKRGKRGRN